jgi:hypothetical protein
MTSKQQQARLDMILHIMRLPSTRTEWTVRTLAPCFGIKKLFSTKSSLTHALNTLAEQGHLIAERRGPGKPTVYRLKGRK